MNKGPEPYIVDNRIRRSEHGRSTVLITKEVVRLVALVITLTLGFWLSAQGASYLRIGHLEEQHGAFWSQPAPEVKVDLFVPEKTGIVLYGTMLGGVLLGQLFAYVIARPNQQIRIKPLLRCLNTGRSWAAALASPLVFFSTFSSLLTLKGPVMYFYALQDGFFCLTIFNGIAAVMVRRDKAK